MAIQELSKVEVEVVAGGLIVLGIDVAAILNTVLTPVLGIVASALTVVANTVTSVGTLVGNALVGVNNTIVGLGL